MFSAVDDKSSADRCQTLGAYDYLIKPCEFTLLKARMWRCLFELKLSRHINLVEHPACGILIVEDNPLNRDLLMRRVKKLGHTLCSPPAAKRRWPCSSGAPSI